MEPEQLGLGHSLDRLLERLLPAGLKIQACKRLNTGTMQSDQGGGGRVEGVYRLGGFCKLLKNNGLGRIALPNWTALYRMHRLAFPALAGASYLAKAICFDGASCLMGIIRLAA